RGGWNRAFLVAGAGGHVHSSTDCSTCRPTTQYAWMTNYSGADEDTIVSDAGYRACTVCYPSAPVGDERSMPTEMRRRERTRCDPVDELRRHVGTSGDGVGHPPLVEVDHVLQRVLGGGGIAGDLAQHPGGDAGAGEAVEHLGVIAELSGPQDQRDSAQVPWEPGVCILGEIDHGGSLRESPAVADTEEVGGGTPSQDTRRCGDARMWGPGFSMPSYRARFVSVRTT